MNPYYEKDGVTIYHGDCRTIAPSVEFDVLVTDPPYGVNFVGKNTKGTTRRNDGYTVGDSDIGPGVVATLLPRSKRALVFCGTRLMFRYPEPYDIGCVYCPAGAGRGRWGWTLYNPILFYGKSKTTNATPAGFESFDTVGETGHPCAKPLRWMLWAVEKASHPSEVILDPFCGSGTTLFAARQLGRRAIGIEIEERYCEIAAKRLGQGVLI